MSSIEDPRIERQKVYDLQAILFLTIAAVICGAESWNDIYAFGKAIRGSAQSSPPSFIHMVSAWSKTNGLSLGQIKVDEKSNEITAIPKLLEILDIEGSTITIDAMGCQKSIAKQIVKKKSSYILAVKGNQKELEENIKAIVEIESYRHHKSSGKEEKETRYYITNLQTTAQTIGKSIRSHWGIENSLHWALDVSFGEDASRKREGNAAENYSRILRIALNLLKNDGNKKRSLKGKRLDAGWNNDYLLRLLKY